MNFNSIDFIFRFLPLFVIAYLLAPAKFKRFVICAGSMVFYGFAGIKYLPALAVFFIVNFFFTRFFIGRRGFVCTLAVLLNLGIIIACRCIGYDIPGLSFVMLEMIGLCIDTYKGREKVNSFWDFGAYFFFFPKLLSGPISKYSEVTDGFKSGQSSLTNVEQGLGTFILGLGYKVILADRISGIFNGITTIGTDAISCGLAWLGVVAISLRLYLDFKGYSLMAVGLAKMMGVRIIDNFDMPYLSKTISEFYRRWHISLGRWFKDYVYIPLGGSRRNAADTIVNLIIVWLLTYLWHGAKMHYFIWAMMLCFFIILEKNIYGKALGKLKVLPHIYVCLVIAASWIFFSFDSMTDIWNYFEALLPPVLHSAQRKAIVNGGDVFKYLGMYHPFLIVGAAMVFSPLERIFKKNIDKWWMKILLLAVLWGSIFILRTQESDPFMYFIF